MDLMQKLDSTVIRVHQSWNFIGRLLARAKICISEGAKTAYTDGLSTITFDPKFIEDKCAEDMVILMAHEILHIILSHTYSWVGVDEPELWNIAEDIVVNSMLDEKYMSSTSSATLFSKANVTINKVGHWPTNDSISIGQVTIHNIKDKTVRDIYWELLKAASEGKGKGGKGGGKSLADSYESMDDHSHIGENDGQNAGGGNKDKPDIDKIHQDWQRAIMQAAADEAKRNKGELPAGLGGLVDEITEAKIPWRERLRNAMMSSIITDSRYTRWNKRNCVLGSPIPGYVREGLNVIVHLDTSGSTSGDLKDFLSEIKGIAGLVPGSHVTVIQCDAEIQSVDDISSDFETFEAKGFGGTSHAPVIKYINEMEQLPKVFISFTDGYSDIDNCYPNLKPGISKIICLPKNAENMQDSLSPYGDVLVID